jgi:xanthine dehydrogenase small subunit
MSDAFTLTINDEEVNVQGVQPSKTLLHYLREAGWVGSKEGCGDGDCGACTVAVKGEDHEGRPRYLAVNSCLIPVAAMAGREIVTVEGVAGNELHPVQRAMVAFGGSQCGYCTPGFVMSLFAGYYSGNLTDDVVEGNLCRCTGYLPIRRAMHSLNEPDEDDRFLRKLAEQSSTTKDRGSVAVHVNGQRFYSPTTLDEVYALLEAHPDAVLVAGATDLGLEFSYHRRHYPILIALERVGELKTIENTSDALTLGAGVTLSQLEAAAAGIVPSLDQMLHLFAARQIRNRATVGGNLGTASPIGDLPPVFLALDAVVTLASKDGAREVPIDQFFTSYRKTVRTHGEVIHSVRLPKGLPAGTERRLNRAYKVAKRGSDDISSVAAAFTLDLGEGGRIVQARLAYGGVAPTPVRAREVEAQLVGRPWSEATMREAKAALHDAFEPISDARASAGYRREVTANLVEKFFLDTQEVLR